MQTTKTEETEDLHISTISKDNESVIKNFQQRKLQGKWFY